MKTNIVAPIGGILILAGGIALSVYTAQNAPVLEKSKEKLVTKYVDLSEKALAKGDLKGAEKMVKKAIVANPSSKTALNEFKKIVLASCPKTTVSTTTTNTNTAPKAETKAKPVQNTAPATPASDDSEEEMGCI